MRSDALKQRNNSLIYICIYMRSALQCIFWWFPWMISDALKQENSPDRHDFARKILWISVSSYATLCVSILVTRLRGLISCKIRSDYCSLRILALIYMLRDVQSASTVVGPSAISFLQLWSHFLRGSRRSVHRLLHSQGQKHVLPLRPLKIWSNLWVLTPNFDFSFPVCES